MPWHGLMVMRFRHALMVMRFRSPLGGDAFSLTATHAVPAAICSGLHRALHVFQPYRWTSCRPTYSSVHRER